MKRLVKVAIGTFIGCAMGNIVLQVLLNVPTNVVVDRIIAQFLAITALVITIEGSHTLNPKPASFSNNE